MAGRSVYQPVSVASWEAQLGETLPDSLRGALPSVAQLENELRSELADEE